MLALQIFSPISRFSITTAVTTPLISFIVYYVLWIIYSRFFHPLSSIPGPFLASITNWWYFHAVRHGIRDNLQLPLHRRYGPIVRVRPNEVSVATASALPVVFGTKPKWQKTDFYDSFDPHIGGRTELFSTRDDVMHTERKRITAGLFAIGTVVQYEPCVERIIDVFVERLGAVAATGKRIEMAWALRCFSLDAIGEIFYGKEGGFNSLRDGTDHKDWMAMLDAMLAPLSSMGYVPTGMKTLYFLSQLLISGVRKGLKAHSSVVEDAQAIVTQRREAMAGGKGVDPQSIDMLSKLINIVDEKGPEIGFTDEDVAVNVYDAIMAGSDTTAINLAHQFYLIIHDRRVYQKLTTEVREAFASGNLSHPVRYADAIKLPYWSACVKECMRFSPGGGVGLPRHVPKEGAMIEGVFLPGRTRVTMNMNVVHFDTRCFGVDAEVFRPERWIEADAERVKEMGRSEFTFGTGPRVCLGRHLALVEIYKLLPALLQRFDFEVVSEPVVQNHWFRRRTNLQMKVSRV